jgi:hypothetical protein
LFAGADFSGSQTYMQLGLGVGYYLTNGLEFGVDSNLWMFGDPTVLDVSPGLTYVFWRVPRIKPYIGAFYRHAFVFDATDLDSVGSRVGLYFVAGRVYLGAGAVYEHWFNCNHERFVSCDDVYPEAVLAITF